MKLNYSALRTVHKIKYVLLEHTVHIIIPICEQHC